MRMRIIVTAVLLIGLSGAVFCSINFFTTPGQTEFGATFSSVYSRGLGLDPSETYLALLDDLRVKKIRLPVYWSEIEPTRGQFYWDELDFFVAAAEQRQVKLTLVIGRKVPRWPECYLPDWAEGLVGSEADEAVLDMEQAVLERYKSSPAVERWQVENEPFLPFGVCPAPSAELLNKEIVLVRALDTRPIVLTVSGEMDPWISTAKMSDVLGISMYRVSYNSTTGLVPYPLTPVVYRFRSMIAGLFSEKIIVSELQAEPWFIKLISEMSAAERAAAFTPEDLKNNAAFAAQAGFSEAYFWGVEWWYAEKLAGRPDLWDAAKELF